MLATSHLRDLAVDPREHPRGQPHLSAASGLVRLGRRLCMVADDEHHIGFVDLDTAAAEPVRLHRILAGDLPADKLERKQRKPDLEALAWLAPDAGRPHGALLALGSGSRPQRERAFLVTLDTDGLPRETRSVDIAALYAPLRATFADLNIEGAFAAEGRLHLLQRGNKSDARNACIAYPLAPLLSWMGDSTQPMPGPAAMTLVTLGELGGVPLGFTDATPLPGGGWLFSAVAEDTSDSYLDGACAGCVIGWMGAGGELLRMVPLSGAPKVEGIALDDGAQRLLLVTDADDPARPSALLSVDLR